MIRTSYIWLIHWGSAILAAALLLSSMLPTGLPRPAWLTLHLSLGWALLMLSAIRCSLAMAKRPQSRLRGTVLRRVAMFCTLAALLLCLGVGVLVYRPSPLGGAAKLFGVLPAPVVHFLHGKQVALAAWLHLTLAYVFLTALILHGVLAFVPYRRGGRRPISWLWNGRRQADTELP